MPGTFEIKKAKDGQTFFRLKAANGEIILASEMYKAKESALTGIESVKKNAPLVERYEKLTSKNGKFYFTLKAANSQVIGDSEMYESESSRDNGIDSVMKNAPEAKIVEIATIG
jgi:uncharacterized protein YegP (UPF0339 family)